MLSVKAYLLKKYKMNPKCFHKPVQQIKTQLSAFFIMFFYKNKYPLHIHLSTPPGFKFYIFYNRFYMESFHILATNEPQEEKKVSIAG